MVQTSTWQEWDGWPKWNLIPRRYYFSRLAEKTPRNSDLFCLGWGYNSLEKPGSQFGNAVWQSNHLRKFGGWGSSGSGETGPAGSFQQQPEMQCSGKEHLGASTHSTPWVLQLWKWLPWHSQPLQWQKCSESDWWLGPLQKSHLNRVFLKPILSHLWSDPRPLGLCAHLDKPLMSDLRTVWPGPQSAFAHE